MLLQSVRTYLMKISISNMYSIIGSKRASILVHLVFNPGPLPILTNAGSWFVLERWISDSPFQHAIQPAQSDLDIARGINAKQILERHWDAWMTEEDWMWISEHGINTVRIPVSCFLHGNNLIS
jgi:aryl-phospho-beta-D-glucosidase BglC (GH1 family)